MSRASLAFLLLQLVAVEAFAASAVTRQVPSEYPTIMDAVDAAQSGDTVLVAPGIYSDYLIRPIGSGPKAANVFLKSGVTIRSEAGPGVTTISFDADEFAPGVVAAFGLTDAATLEGFTLTGENSEFTVGAINEGGKVVFRNCVVRGVANGIGAVNTSLDFVDCVFEDIGGFAINGANVELHMERTIVQRCWHNPINLYKSNSFGGAPALSITQCEFRDNQSDSGSSCCSAVSLTSCVVLDSWFENNTGGIWGCLDLRGALGAQVRVERCTFSNNTVSGAFGAVASFGVDADQARVVGNTIWRSTQTSTLGAAGSAVAFGGGTIVFEHNVIAGSRGKPAVSNYASDLQNSCNVYFDNQPRSLLNFTLGPGSIEADPEFCGVDTGDFTVQSSSPCLPKNNSSCEEQIGAYGEGCGTVSVEPQSWGRIKSAYREGN